MPVFSSPRRPIPGSAFVPLMSMPPSSNPFLKSKHPDRPLGEPADVGQASRLTVKPASRRRAWENVWIATQHE